jgi:hypothetical protein
MPLVITICDPCVHGHVQTACGVAFVLCTVGLGCTAAHQAGPQLPWSCALCCCRTVTATRKSGLADKVLKSGRGRAVQMNAGAKSAKGDLLCFLHADTQPPSDLVRLHS